MAAPNNGTGSDWPIHRSDGVSCTWISRRVERTGHERMTRGEFVLKIMNFILLMVINATQVGYNLISIYPNDLQPLNNTHHYSCRPSTGRRCARSGSPS